MDELKDKYIRQKLQEDKFVSDNVNDVFEKFKREKMLNIEEISKEEFKKDNNKIVQFFSYKRMSKFLSVAAVFLCIIIAGSASIYYNITGKNNYNVNISSNSINSNNGGFKYSKEEIISQSENELINVLLINNQDVVIQLKDKFIKLYNLNLSSNEQYKVNGITKPVKNVFVGYVVNNQFPYVFLVMEDGTAECVQIINDTKIPSGDYQFKFSTQGTIEGLYDVVGFEQQTRTFSYSPDKYYYVNAIRNDGVKKEIEIGYYNDWNDKSTRTYDSLNQKYIQSFDQNAIVDDGSNDVIENNKIIYNLNIDNSYSYYMLDNNFYRIDNESKAEECLATGINGVLRDNSDGKLTVLLNEKYTINIVDKNIIYNEHDVVRTGTFLASRGSDGVFLESKRDGSLILLLEIGTLEKLGINKNETNIKENVRYNIYGESFGKYNSTYNTTIADVKTFEIGEVAPNSSLSIVYAKNDDTIVCIDLKEAIQKSNLHLVRKVMKEASNVQAFKIEAIYENINGQDVEKYRTIYTIEKREGNTVFNREINYND